MKNLLLSLILGSFINSGIVCDPHTDEGYYSRAHSFSEELLIAVTLGDITTIKMRLGQSNVNIDFQDMNGWTPLHKAAWKGDPEIVELLLDNGANPNIKNNKDRTPLHVVAIRDYTVANRKNSQIIKKNSQIIKLLRKAGANFNAQDKKCRKPIVYAETPEIRALLCK